MNAITKHLLPLLLLFLVPITSTPVSAQQDYGCPFRASGRCNNGDCDHWKLNRGQAPARTSPDTSRQQAEADRQRRIQQEEQRQQAELERQRQFQREAQRQQEEEARRQRALQQDYQDRKQAQEQRSNAEYQRKSTALQGLSDSLTDSLQQYAREKQRQSDEQLRKIDEEIELDKENARRESARRAFSEENARREATRSTAAQRTANPAIASAPRVNSGNNSPPPPPKASPLFDEPLSSFIRTGAPESENGRRTGSTATKPADTTSGNSLLSQLLGDMQAEPAKPSRGIVEPRKPALPETQAADLMKSLLDKPRPATR